MALDLSSLKRAVGALEKSLALGHGDLGSLEEGLRDTVRAGVIQNFEVAYELCWKFLQRWIRENRTPEDADNPRTRKELFRLAARYGLIDDPTPWFGFGEARNMSSHTYDEAQAAAVYEAARAFLPHAQGLASRLAKNND